ncbi:MAG: ABC transporter permease [Bryobacteraceae bacterium]|nr:ABC transporter permease [Bryobacteraceae bacterium]
MSLFPRPLLHALRRLGRSPGFTIPAVVILALGIGANTAIFSVVSAVLLNPLPFGNPDSLVTVFHVPPQQSFPGVPIFAVSAGNYLDWKKQADSFESMAVIGGHNFRLGGGNRPQAVTATRTEPDFFRVLQVSPEFGRAFTADECQPGKERVTVLSHGFAQAQFGSAGAAVGRTLELDGRAYLVIGVMPASFHLPAWFPSSTSMWVPVAWTAEDRAVRGNHNYLTVARRKAAVPLNQAQKQMEVISDQLARAYPEENTGWGAVAIPLRDHLVGDVRPALLTLLGAVGFVLLIACANIANLLLTRTIGRRKELAIRAALGASTSQTILPVIGESVLLSLIGGALGLLLAKSGQALVLGALAEKMPRATEVHLDARVLLFTLAASVLTGVLSGWIAASRLLQLDLNESLKQGGGKSSNDSGGNRTRSVLVAAEVALSLVLLVGAGLMIRSLWALHDVDPGFQPEGVITMTIPVPQSAPGAARNRFYDEFLPEVRRIPGVLSAGATDTLPLDGGGSQQPVVIEGRPAEVFALQPNIDVRVVTPGYFQTMRIPLVSGRDFEERDTTGDRPVIIISQAMARQFWPGESAVGKRLRISFSPEKLREVVGVAGDIKERGLDVPRPIPILYEPLPQNTDNHVSLVVRSRDSAARPVEAVTAILQRIDPQLPLRDIRPMEELVAASLLQRRFTMLLFTALAALACLLAAVGIYSVIAYSVRKRVQEIGIRMALGARAADVMRMVVAQGMKPALLGLAAGGSGAYLLSDLLARLTFGVSPTDPATFLAVAALLAAVALSACVIPAWRASRVDPLTALRDE